MSLTHFLAKMKISRMVSGGGDVIFEAGRWKFQIGWGGLCEIPSVVGVWMLFGTTQSLFISFPKLSF